MSDLNEFQLRCLELVEELVEHSDAWFSMVETEGECHRYVHAVVQPGEIEIWIAPEMVEYLIEGERADFEVCAYRGEDELVRDLASSLSAELQLLGSQEQMLVDAQHPAAGERAMLWTLSTLYLVASGSFVWLLSGLWTLGLVFEGGGIALYLGLCLPTLLAVWGFVRLARGGEPTVALTVSALPWLAYTVAAVPAVLEDRSAGFEDPILVFGLFMGAVSIGWIVYLIGPGPYSGANVDSG